MKNAQKALPRAKFRYYIDEGQIRDALQRRASFNAIDLESTFKLDVFVPKLRPYDQQVFERSQKAALDEAEGAREFNFASPEDIVLKKLEYLEGGEVSERQRNDVLGVLKVQGKSLDFYYIRKWAAELGIADVVDRALGDAGMLITFP